MFLLDEHVPPAVGNAVAGREPAITVLGVGIDPSSPPTGTLDPDLLAFAEAERLAVVTFDKTTMPGHAARHVAGGRHTWGVFVFPDGNDLSAGRVAAELELVWGASEADEWIDRVEFLPY